MKASVLSVLLFAALAWNFQAASALDMSCLNFPLTNPYQLNLVRHFYRPDTQRMGYCYNVSYTTNPLYKPGSKCSNMDLTTLDLLLDPKCGSDPIDYWTWDKTQTFSAIYNSFPFRNVDVRTFRASGWNTPSLKYTVNQMKGSDPHTLCFVLKSTTCRTLEEACYDEVGSVPPATTCKWAFGNSAGCCPVNKVCDGIDCQRPLQMYVFTNETIPHTGTFFNSSMCDDFAAAATTVMLPSAPASEAFRCVGIKNLTGPWPTLTLTHPYFPTYTENFNHYNLMPIGSTGDFGTVMAIWSPTYDYYKLLNFHANWDQAKITQIYNIMGWLTNPKMECQTITTESCVSRQYMPGVTQCIPRVYGDPHIEGFDGSHFMFTGWPDAVFNMLSHKSYQINALLKKYEHTAHLKTWIGAMGIKIGTTDNVQVTAAGLGQLKVEVNGKEIELGSKVNLNSPSSIDYQTKGVGQIVRLETPDMTIEIEINRWSLMFDVPKISMTMGDMHGILGQTYKHMVNQAGETDGLRHPISGVEGEEADYYVSTGLLGDNFVFNQYQGTEVSASTQKTTRMGASSARKVLSEVAMTTKASVKL